MSVILVFLLAVAAIVGLVAVAAAADVASPGWRPNQAGDVIPVRAVADADGKDRPRRLPGRGRRLFALFISAYFMRMELADWRPLPMPGLLGSTRWCSC